MEIKLLCAHQTEWMTIGALLTNEAAILHFYPASSSKSSRLSVPHSRKKKNPPETETRRKLQSLSSSTRLRALRKLISSSILLWREIGSNFLCTLRISPRDYNKCEFPWPFPRHWANTK